MKIYMFSTIIYLITICTPIIINLTSCSPPTSNMSSDDNNSPNVKVSSIAYLKGLYNYNTFYISTDIVVEGKVIANNAYGEFPNSIIIEDSSGAIEIMCDIDCVASGFIVGTTVKVLCSGLYLGSSGGMLSLGGAPDDDYPITSLDDESVALHLQMENVSVVDPTPLEIELSELNTTHILRYVVVEGLNFILSADSPTTFCSRNIDTGRTENTTHTLIDDSGIEIPLSVSHTVTYADDNLPTTPVTLYAIVEYFNGVYRLRIVNCGYIS